MAAVFRFPLFSIGDGAEGREASFKYFFTRFLYPELEIRVLWKAVESFSLSFAFRTLFPIFHLWGGEDLPFSDQMIFMGDLGFRIPLKPQEEPESDLSSSAE